MIDGKTIKKWVMRTHCTVAAFRGTATVQVLLLLTHLILYLSRRRISSTAENCAGLSLSRYHNQLATPEKMYADFSKSHQTR